MNLEDLKQLISAGTVTEQEKLSSYTTFGVGGPARFFVTPGTIDELSALLCFLNENGEEYFILGNGSNLLVSDRGYQGTVINLGRNSNDDFSTMTCYRVDGVPLIRASAGVKLAAVSRLAERNSLTGLEALSGIPGSVGGAVYMNAGAYGTEVKDVFSSCRALTKDGKILDLKQTDIDFGYRFSSVSSDDRIVLDVTLQLTDGNAESIRSLMQEYADKRKSKQPIELPSAGSTFKRPAGYFAGKLIEDAGLRGYRLGGASVSSKHCGFIVNDNKATADEIYQLINYVKNRVFENSGVLLETEVKMIGEFS